MSSLGRSHHTNREIKLVDTSAGEGTNYSYTLHILCAFILIKFKTSLKFPLLAL